MQYFVYLGVIAASLVLTLLALSAPYAEAGQLPPTTTSPKKTVGAGR